MNKNEIADVLKEIGTLLELKGENPFKTRAYQTGARTLESLEEDLGEIIVSGRLSEIKGIGAALTQKISELYTTGHLRFYDELRASVAPGLIEMLDIPGLGPKKILALHQQLGIQGIPELAKACAEGFVAQPILAGLRELKGVIHVEHAGSLRRGLETVGDLDFIVASDTRDEHAITRIVEWFTTRHGVHEVTAKGTTKASVRYESGLQADLRIVPDAQFAFALHHFTGSKDHNVSMRQRALARGLSLSEWGLEPSDGEGSVKSKAASHSITEKNHTPKITTEAELFRALDLAYIAPELREGLGEIEQADLEKGSGKLPSLIELKDLRGAFHNHTLASDGRASLDEMVAGAQALGWEYIGIADHSKSSFQARGLTEAQLLEQVARITSLNASKKYTTHVFAGTECDILSDGALDFDDAALAQLDYVVASVHNGFSQDESQMTARIIRALENPYVTMLGHLTGRLLLRREGYHVNASKIIDAAITNHVVIELNATPARLDMDWRLWRRAAERGLLCSINPDAHAVAHLCFIQAGINAARKGCLTKENVVNTLSLKPMCEWLLKNRALKTK